jgi:cytidylate kinase
VVEGRDIGTVVLPDADLKIYLTASPAERARRRAEQRPDGRSVEEIAAQLSKRDHLDSTRRASPLPSADEMADDAVVVDSTGKTVQSIVEEVLR